MKLTARIGTATYKILLSDKLLLERNAYGLTEYLKYTITLDASLVEQPHLFVQTLLHELNHAALHEMGVRVEDSGEEERIVDSIAMVLSLIFADNPKLTKLLVQGPNA